ncbi:hypothetical protein [Paenibacillus sp. FSL R5-0519]|uniref:DUF7448 domain-containing protein n=1 Tax=Paenibacillus sp. FSL R5-0519 TaxID=2921648 RepID=UPI0030D85C51
MGWNSENVSVLIGKTLLNIENSHDDEMAFITTDGDRFRMYHEQDCCEYVRIEDICGDLNDLIGVPILMAEEVSGYSGEFESCEGDGTWTFYKFATVKGYVTIRWYGESNGYYSESVDFHQVS